MIKKITMAAMLVMASGAQLSASNISLYAGASQVSVDSESNVGGLIGMEYKLFDALNKKLSSNVMIDMTFFDSGYLGSVAVDLRYKIVESFSLGVKLGGAGYSQTVDTQTTDAQGFVYGADAFYNFNDSHAVGLAYTTGSLSPKETTAVSVDVSQASLVYKYHF